MSKKQVRAKPRRERTHPYAPRIVSIHFPEGFKDCGDCYVPLEDHRKLQKKYIQLFKRYKNSIDNK